MIIFSILAVLVNLINSYVVARFARKMFATTLAGSFLFSCLAIGIIVESSFDIGMMSSMIFWGIVLTIAVLILVLANPLRYFIAYGFFFLLLITALLPFDLPGLIKDSSIVALLLILVPVVPVIIFRQNIKLITIGLSSGGSLGFGLISLINLLAKPTDSILLMYALLYVASIAFGIYFQFRLYDQYFGKSEEQALNS
ncbi:MAG: hypothetical protein ACK5GO_02430 [Ignavibacteria bacterium]|jgi:hypothetical protein